MKNIILSALIISSVLTSCSSDDGSEDSVEPVKLLTNSSSSIDGEVLSTTEYVYNDDNVLTEQKLSSTPHSGVEYRYENGKLVRYDRIYEEGADISTAYILLEYDSADRLTRLTHYDINDDIRTDFEYTYNTSGTLLTRSVTNTLSNTNRFYDYEYNATENSLKRTLQGEPDGTFEVYTFDDKKSPYTNLPYVLKELTASGRTLNGNNLSKIEYYEADVLTRTLNFVNEYDAEGFLTKSTITDTTTEITVIDDYTYTVR